MSETEVIPRGGRLGPSIAAVAAVAALAYAGLVSAHAVIREAAFFHDHGSIRARALAIPGRLAATERAIRAEQRRILAAQAAIRDVQSSHP